MKVNDNNSKRFWASKQRGAMSTDMIITMGVFIAIIVVVAMGGPTMWYQYKKYKFTSQFNQVTAAADVYKGGGRSSYSGVSLTQICSDGIIKPDNELCASSSTANPYGGSVAVTAATNTSELTYTATGIPAAHAANFKRDLDYLGVVTISGTTISITK